MRFILAVALLAGANLFLHAHSAAERVPKRDELASFPLQIGEWRGIDLGIQADVQEILGMGDFLSRVYRRSPQQPSIDLFLAYFPTQRTGNTIHSPEHCLPGSGWVPVEHHHIQLAGPKGAVVTVNRYLIARGLDRQLVLYWYDTHGRIVASEYWSKFYLVADSIRMNRSDGAFVRIITPLAQDESLQAGQERAIGFAEQLIRLVGDYFPP